MGWGSRASQRRWAEVQRQLAGEPPVEHPEPELPDPMPDEEPMSKAETDDQIAKLLARIEQLEAHQIPDADEFADELDQPDGRRAKTAMTGTMTAQEFIEANAAANAAANAKLRDPSNRTHPAVSVFNPQGERDHPKEKLTREVYWIGTRVREDELTPEEIALLNLVQPGMYHRNQWRVIERPGSTHAKLRLDIILPCKKLDDQMELPRSMTAALQEILGAVPAPPASLAEAHAEIARLHQELRLASAT